MKPNLPFLSILVASTSAAWLGFHWAATGSSDLMEAPKSANSAAPQPQISTLLTRQSRLGNLTPLGVPLPSLKATTSSLLDAPVSEKQAYREYLETLSPESIFQLWLREPETGGDRFRMELAVVALGSRLNQPENRGSPVVHKLEAYALDNSHPAFMRSDALQALGYAASPEATESLLKATRTVDELLSRQAAYLLTELDYRAASDADRDRISAVLERHWAEGVDTEFQLTGIALGLAKLGRAGGLRILMGRITQAGVSVSEFEQNDDAVAWGVYDCLGEVSNPNAIPFLSASLAGQPISNTEAVAAGHALASMGNPEATRSLISWMQSVTGDVTPHIQAWLLKIRDPESIGLADQMIEQPFANESNRAAAVAALKQWHSYRSFVAAEK